MFIKWFGGHSWLALLTLVAEAVIGYPAWLNALVPHPVVWAGAAINALERRWNNPQYSFRRRRLLGCVTVVLVTGAALALGAAVEGSVFLVGYILQAATFSGGDSIASPWPGLLVLGVFVLVATTGLAQKSLFVHVRNVLIALRGGDLAIARDRVSLIVGRDTRQLDEPGVSAAALESLAESFNDGIVAPAFWLVLGGLPGLRLQGAEHRRQPHWSQRRALARIWLGCRARR